MVRMDKRHPFSRISLETSGKGLLNTQSKKQEV